LIQGLAVANPARIEAAASALAKLNGLSFRASRAALPDFSRAGRGIAVFKSEIGGLSSALAHLQSALAGISASILGRSIYQTGAAFQTLQRTLGAVATSQGEVAEQMQFLEKLTKKMPVSLEAVADSYGRFTIAARLAGVSTEDAQKTFSGFATALAAMGASAEAQKLTFNALIQIFSKGKIQAEEWRQQIGDHMPGAFSLLAESMGVTTAELSKLMDNGQVLSSELPKLATLLESRFGPAVQLAMQRAGAALTDLGNEWTNVKRTIFDGGFEAGLGAIARSLTEALRTDVVHDFARDLGQGFQTAATYMAAFVKTISTNATALKAIFAGLSVVIASVLARSLLFVLGPAVSTAIAGFKALGKAAIGAQARLLAIPATLTLAAVAADQMLNSGRGTAYILDKLGNAAKTVGEGFGKMFHELSGGTLDGIGEDFAKHLKEAQDAATRIQNSPLFDPSTIQKNSDREAAAAAKKLTALTDQERELWDQVNPIAKANVEYQEQLRLLDAIVEKKGIDAAPFKAALAAKTLDDRNPAGALARDLRDELATLRAKTGETKALAAAQRDYVDLLQRGQDVGKAGLDALRQYHTAVARMNGEIGSGIERWTTTVGDFADNMAEAVKDGVSGLSDELSKLLTGAETDFRALARSILASFVKIGIDSILKDIFGAMGLDPAKQAQSVAEQALAKLAGIGENITTAQSNVYTTGLSINGVPLADVLADPSRITRSALPDIPDSSVAGRLSTANERFPIEGSIPGLRGALPASAAANVKFAAGSAPASALQAITAAPTTALQAIESAMGGATASLRYVNQSATRNMKLTASLESKIQEAVGAVYGPGARADIYSGGQPVSGPNRVGSVRHNLGMAADAYIYDANGNRLRGDALAPLGQYWQARKFGGTGLEMGGGGIHLDEWAKPPKGGSMDWSYGNRTAKQLEAIRAGQSGIMPPGAGIDPTVTGSIDQLKAKMSEVSTAAQQGSTGLDQMKTKLTETGSSAQQGAQNAQIANQMKTQSELQMGLTTSQVGVQAQTAGLQAQGAGPQFASAGQSIASAGQSAAMGAQAAQSATPGLQGFGNGITSLLGPLASAIPGLGQFGGMIVQLIQQLAMSSMGGLAGGLFKEGGLSSSPVARASLPLAAWAGAPHYAEGTANTSGGRPAILHDNEAVIPLSRGRKVPVEIANDDASPMRGTGVGSRGRGATINNFNFTVKDEDSFRKSKAQVQSQVLSAMGRAMRRDM